jgi:hypothetical protein
VWQSEKKRKSRAANRQNRGMRKNEWPEYMNLLLALFMVHRQTIEYILEEPVK